MPHRRRFIFVLLLCCGGHLAGAAETLRVTETRVATFPPKGHWRNVVVTDGGKVLYVIEDPPETYTTYLDGKPIAGFDSILHGSLISSPDSKRYAFFALRGGKLIPVVDGVEWPAFNPAPESWAWWLNRFYFSPDSRRIAYIGSRAGRLVMDVDGKQHTAGDVENVTFSPDSQHLACFRRNPATGVMSIEIDGVARPEYPNPTGGEPVYSPDGRSTAYMTCNPDALVVVGENARSYPRAGTVEHASIALGPAGKPLFWSSQSADERVAFCDGQRIDPKGSNVQAVAFSPDGRRTAYGVGMREDRGTVVVDGAPHPITGAVEGWLSFSPDSKRVACVSRQYDSPPPHYFATGSRLWVSVIEPDGKLTQWDGEHFVFSPDSKHVLRWRESLLAVDDRETPLQRNDFPWAARFNGPHKVRAIVIRGHDVLRLDVDLEGD